ncbi:Ubiquitin carboxyl-terminal hydrolase 17-like protein E [Durusdinium trenchii]|uniref:Ubiquitin carboxyl-terminal hydrolase 17-like protein E n=1 Tax=Durusdinium trenchii TaxID=1381693 RepID=A0ABP0HUV1_9DINO
MAGLTDREKIAALAPDLQGLLDSRRVPEATQAGLHDLGIDNVAMLSAVAIDRTSLETLARSSLGIDVTARPADAIIFASLFLAWQSATKRMEARNELEAEAVAAKVLKAIPNVEIQLFRAEFEKRFFRLKDAECPGKPSFEDLCEQIDSGELRPMALRHFGSRNEDDDAETGNIHVGKTGVLKIKKAKIETSSPTNMEEFRSKIMLMVNHFIFARFRYPSKEILKDINPFVAMEYLNYICSKDVAQLESMTVDGVTLHRPSLKLIISYEYQMRKEAVDEINKGVDFVSALRAVTKNPDVRERHFSTPLAVSSATQSVQDPWRGKSKNIDRPHPYDTNFIKGKNKGRGKGKKGKGKAKQGGLQGSTPDGQKQKKLMHAKNSESFICLLVPKRLAATAPKRCSMVVDSFDILRSTSHDLLDKTLQEDLIQKLKKGYYQAVIMSPPCATWSRVTPLLVHSINANLATDNAFATTAAAYPPAMDHWLATLLIIDQILKIWKGNHLAVLEEANMMVFPVKEKVRRTLKVTILALSTGKVDTYVTELGKKGRLKLIAELALGRHDKSPFGGVVDCVRERLDEVVRDMGQEPLPKEGDIPAEIALRRVLAWGKIVEDADHRFVEDMVTTGAPLGVRGEIPWVEAVYDKKPQSEEAQGSRWEEDVEEAIIRENYASAKEHMDKVKGHVPKDVEKGWMVEVSKAEAEGRYGDELQVASLGAVPKDKHWADVRVVHDGAHGLKVNTRLSQPNRMAFPQFGVCDEDPQRA